MTPAASGGRRPRVLLASGPVGALSPLQASVALARGFVDGADVAVIGLAEGGRALGEVLAEPDGDLEVLHAGWLARRDGLLAVGAEPDHEPPYDPLEVSSSQLGRLVAYALQEQPPTRLVIDLTTSNTHDAGRGLLHHVGELRPRLQGVDVIGVVPSGQQHDRLLGLRGVTSRRGRELGIALGHVMAVEGTLERFALEVDAVAAKAEGAGASGGLGFAILALGGRLVTGAALTAELGDLDRALGSADLVVTGCDSFDFGSRGGGVVAELATRCEAFEVPLVVVSPVVGMSGREMRTLGIESAHPVPVDEGVADGLTATGRRLAAGWTSRW